MARHNFLRQQICLALATDVWDQPRAERNCQEDRSGYGEPLKSRAAPDGNSPRLDLARKCGTDASSEALRRAFVEIRSTQRLPHRFLVAEFPAAVRTRLQMPFEFNAANYIQLE